MYGSTPRKISPDDLDALMKPDHVIRVYPDGTISDPYPMRVDGREIYAPELHDGHLCGDGWRLLNGYSGQWMYPGPIMHASEFIGGRLARDILERPGLYVALVDYPADGGEPGGWAVAFYDLGEEPQG
jgi:hypothetical protein